MKRFLAAVIVGGSAMVQLPIAHSQPQQAKDPPTDLQSATESGNLTVLPPLPSGKSTILGGSIRDVDPVLDQFTLKIYGQRPLKIYFDERTQLFRNGAKVPLRQLHPEEHASVQTTLDGGNVFALSIHTLSEAPQGECEGQVQSYDPATRELRVSSKLTPEPIRMLLSDQAQVVREGQQAFVSAGSGISDLVSGSLVIVKFGTDGKGQAIANHVTVLARPGSSFVFSGRISSLDMPSGMLMLVDPRDGKTYQIFFNPSAIHGSANLHIGDQVRVSAQLADSRYMAGEITVTSSQQP